jgi:hypothetical protein
MGVETETALPANPPLARIYKATRGSLGRVIRGVEITEPEAIAERLAGRDVVVCDGPPLANRRLALRIENSLGPCFRQDPHKAAGPYALPHFQQLQPPPQGHTFYETPGKKAARNP